MSAFVMQHDVHTVLCHAVKRQSPHMRKAAIYMADLSTTDNLEAKSTGHVLEDRGSSPSTAINGDALAVNPPF